MEWNFLRNFFFSARISLKKKRKENIFKKIDLAGNRTLEEVSDALTTIYISFDIILLLETTAERRIADIMTDLVNAY